jgi:Ca2+-binding EF-hand superfamily protein
MISRRMVVGRVTGLAALGTFLARSSAFAASDYETLKGLDPDHDGTVSLEEAKALAARLFDMLDRDHDGTLTRHELSGRVSVRELRAADPDHDRAISKDEYLALVEQRFQAADADHDGTLTPTELRSKAGRELRRLLV